MTTHDMDLDNIQGAVLRGYRLPVADYVFLRFEEPAGGRSWLARSIPVVTTSELWESKPDWALNVAFTASGLGALGLGDESLQTFPEEFRAGMAARADLLGDSGDSAPERWEAPLGTGEVHGLVMISGKDPATLDARLGALRQDVQASPGVSILGDQRGAALPGGTEHFGFADGFAQPSVAADGMPDRPGQGAPERGWRAIQPGEFVLGYPDEEGVPPEAPAPEELTRDGTFMVYRKLRQNVPAFREMVRQAARHYPGGEELLAAKLVGRWRDGTPLALSPERPDPDIVADQDRNNAFRYGVDPDGLRCPVGAHIRRTNPRDGLPFEGKLVNRHRLLRRGLPYGEPLPEGAPDDGRDRGVIFMCFQASIARQFEFIQSQWVNDGNAFRLGDDKDAIVGDNDGTGKMTIPGRPPFFCSPLVRAVTVRGGEYLFTPGIHGLRYLSRLGEA